MSSSSLQSQRPPSGTRSKTPENRSKTGCRRGSRGGSRPAGSSGRQSPLRSISPALSRSSRRCSRLKPTVSSSAPLAMRERKPPAAERQLSQSTQRSDKPLYPIDVGVLGYVGGDSYPVVEPPSHRLARQIVRKSANERAPSVEFYPVNERETAFLVRRSCEQDPPKEILLVQVVGATEKVRRPLVPRSVSRTPVSSSTKVRSRQPSSL